MSERKTYVDLFAPLLLAALFLLGRLCWQAAVRYAQERAVYTVSFSFPSGEITRALFEQMEDFPGFCGYRAMYSRTADIWIGPWHAAAKIRGVESDTYPLTVIWTAGEKRFGAKPLLIVGEDFFGGLKDAQDRTISERQARVLMETQAVQGVSLIVTDEEADGSEKKTEAEILGTVREEGVYMEAGQMKEWMEASGFPCRITEAELHIRGRKNAEKACECLQEAGFAECRLINS